VNAIPEWPFDNKAARERVSQQMATRPRNRLDFLTPPAYSNRIDCGNDRLCEQPSTGDFWMRKLFTWFPLIGVLVGFASPTFSQGTIYGTLGPGNAFDSNDFIQVDGSLLSTNHGYAELFTSPITAYVGTVSLALEAVSSGATVTLSIQSDFGGLPNTSIVSFNSVTIPATPGIVTFTATENVSLDAGTHYWLVIRAPVDSGSVADWFDNNQGINAQTALDEVGGSWTSLGTNPAPAFDIEAVPEPNSFALGVVGVLVCLSHVWQHGRVARSPHNQAPTKRR